MLRIKLPKIAHLIAVVFAAIAGIACIVMAVTQGSARLGVWGGALLVASALALIGGGIGTPRGGVSPPAVGAKFTEIAEWATLAIMLVFAAAIVIGIFVD